jgi:phosphoribosyl-ATP pyrophosphohydrolase
MVLLRHEEISIEEIESELARRFGVSGHDEKASREKK